MSQNTSKQTGTARAVVILCFTVAFLAAASARAGAQSGAATEPASLIGTWTVQVTLRNCTTNAPLGPPFNSLVTFHGHGTLSESAGGLAFAPGQRSPGHGTWTRKRGHTYGQEMPGDPLEEWPDIRLPPGTAADLIDSDRGEG